MTIFFFFQRGTRDVIDEIPIQTDKMLDNNSLECDDEFLSYVWGDMLKINIKAFRRIFFLMFITIFFASKITMVKIGWSHSGNGENFAYQIYDCFYLFLFFHFLWITHCLSFSMKKSICLCFYKFFILNKRYLGWMSLSKKKATAVMIESWWWFSSLQCVASCLKYQKRKKIVLFYH